MSLISSGKFSTIISEYCLSSSGTPIKYSLSCSSSMYFIFSSFIFSISLLYVLHSGLFFSDLLSSTNNFLFSYAEYTVYPLNFKLIIIKSVSIHFQIWQIFLMVFLFIAYNFHSLSNFKIHSTGIMYL